jgi:threonylcarbamoyladenosine tRNA methylthiotransferase MtaB
MTSFAIQSFGCRVNQAEAFAWADMLQKHGLVYRSDCLHSDIVLVNSCTLTRRADRDVRHFLNKIARVNPEARVVLTGCYAERFSRDWQDQHRVWKVVRNAEKDDLPKRILAITGRGVETESIPFRSRALIKIQDGCDFRCTFCIIPHVRGKSVSLPEKTIIHQAQVYVEQGYREIVLTGIHLCSYGNERPGQDSLAGLLMRLEKIKGLGRIRLSSLDPRMLDRKLRDTITRIPTVCPHFHLSLQHGCDDLIQRMGRKVKVADYRDILGELRRKKPYAALGADLIVGFPGETERDYETMFDFLEESPLTYFHVFSYSPRPGTPAFGWEQVDGKIKKKRAAQLRALSKKKNADFRRELVGNIHEGVVIRKREGTAQILLSNYVPVQVSRCEAPERELVRVRITNAGESQTEGQIVHG